MSAKRKRSKTRRAPKRGRALPRRSWIIALSSIALLVSAYLLWGSLRGEHLPGCGPESGCDEVLGSRWSSWLGVPVSLPALLTYLAVFGALALHRQPGTDRMRQRLELVFVALGSAILGAAVWFVLLQLLVIRAVCPFCMIAHACGLGVGVLLLLAVLRVAGFRTAAILGTGAALVLVGGQLVYQPAQFQVSAIPASTLEAQGGSAVSSATPAEEDTTSTETPESRPAPRLLQLHKGLFELNLNEVPVIGSPDAPQLVLHFFDYSCSHCRSLHPLLTNVQHALGDRLATVNLPVPLEPDCNPILKRHLPDHTNACAYAKLGLAVWRADSTQFPGFEDWIFSFPRPPHPEVVRQEAAQRVGEDALRQALQDPWIDGYLALSIRIYHTNYLRFRKSALPLLMTGSGLVSGQVRSTNDLYRILGLAE
jgi:uncharacterized membrane protein